MWVLKPLSSIHVDAQGCDIRHFSCTVRFKAVITHTFKTTECFSRIRTNSAHHEYAGSRAEQYNNSNLWPILCNLVSFHHHLLI